MAEALPASEPSFDAHGPLVLTRVQLFRMGPVSSRRNLALLPPGKSGQQKVVVADDNGNLHCLQVCVCLAECALQELSTSGPGARSLP